MRLNANPKGEVIEAAGVEVETGLGMGAWFKNARFRVTLGISARTLIGPARWSGFTRNTVEIGASHCLLLPWVCSGPKLQGGYDSHATRTVHAAAR